MSEAGRAPGPDGGPPRRGEWNQAVRWVAGAGLVTLGVALLMESWGAYISGPQRAIYIMVPALAGFAAALYAYAVNGGITRGVRTGVVLGILLTVVAGDYYFDLEWDQAWPVFLILLGIGVLLESFWRR